MWWQGEEPRLEAAAQDEARRRRVCPASVGESGRHEEAARVALPARAARSPRSTVRGRQSLPHEDAYGERYARSAIHTINYCRELMQLFMAEHNEFSLGIDVLSL